LPIKPQLSSAKTRSRQLKTIVFHSLTYSPLKIGLRFMVKKNGIFT